MRNAIPLFDYYNLREGYTRDEPKKIIRKNICSYCGKLKPCYINFKNLKGEKTYMCDDCEKL